MTIPQNYYEACKENSNTTAYTGRHYTNTNELLRKQFTLSKTEKKRIFHAGICSHFNRDGGDENRHFQHSSHQPHGATLNCAIRIKYTRISTLCKKKWVQNISLLFFISITCSNDILDILDKINLLHLKSPKHVV